MSQKGFIPPLILLVVGLILGLGIATAYFKSQQSNQTPSADILLPAAEEEATPSATTSESQPKPTSKPNVTQISPSSTPAPSLVPLFTCHIFAKLIPPATMWDDGSTFNVKLSYSINTEIGQRVDRAQWDYDGDGNWDTDWMDPNSTITHQYPYTKTSVTKLRLKISNGEFSLPCSKTILPPGLPGGF